MIQVRDSVLPEERKSTRDGINEGKTKSFFGGGSSGTGI
jgi:hypothetical protein